MLSQIVYRLGNILAQPFTLVPTWFENVPLGLIGPFLITPSQVLFMTFGKLENKYTYKCESHLKSKIPAGVLLPQTFEGRLLILTHLAKNYGHSNIQYF